MTFDEMFDRLMEHEGGYTDGAGDPGGATKWGISQRAYPDLDIKALTRDQSKALYKRDFWRRLDGDRLPAALAWQVFDFAVNSGIETAIRKLQVALGVADDGHFGPLSQQAVLTWSDSDIVMRLIAERMDYQTKLSNWPTAGKGWTRRNAANLRYAAEDTGCDLGRFERQA